MIASHRSFTRSAHPWILSWAVFGATTGCTKRDETSSPPPPVDATEVRFANAKSWARDHDGVFAWVDDDAPGGFWFPAIDPDRVGLTTGDDRALEIDVQLRSNGLFVSSATVTGSEALVAWVDDREVSRQRVRRVVREGDTPIADFWRRWDAARALYRVPDRDGAREAWLELAHHPARAEVEGQIAMALGNAAYTLYTEDRFAEAADLLRRADTLVKPLNAGSHEAALHFHEAQLAHFSGAYLRGLREMERALAGARAHHEERLAALSRLRVGVSLLELGRIGEALDVSEETDGERPQSTSISIAANRAWIRRAAMEAGLIAVDYESIRAEHRWAGDAAFEEKNHASGLNQRAREAAVLFEAGRLSEARVILDEIDARDAEVPGYARTFLEILRARVEIRERAFDAARTRVERMTDTNRPDTNTRCHAIELLGEIDQAEGHLERALAHHREAADCLDELDRRLVTVSASAQWASAHGSPRARMARALVLLGRHDEAFRLLDAARASVLEQRIDALAVDGRAELWFAYQTARRAEERLREQGCAAEPTRGARAKCAAELDAHARATRRTFEAFQANVAPRESTRRDAAWLQSLRRKLGPRRALLLVSGHDDDVLHFLVDAQGVASSTATNPIEHWADALASVEHLFIVPDWHPRSFDPFAAAPTRSMSLLPHADVLSRDRNDHAGPAIVIADPEGSLPKSEKEGAWVAERLAAESIPHAYRKDWLDAVRRAGVLHHAGHAEGTRGDPWSVRLRLAGGETLDVFDLLAAPALPRLVVLNGCATGPKARAGGGGLPAALVHRGAGHVITTSDVIEDGAATAFLRDFYDADGAEEPAEAFRIAVAKSIEREDGAWKTMRLWGR